MNRFDKLVSPFLDDELFVEQAVHVPQPVQFGLGREEESNQSGVAKIENEFGNTSLNAEDFLLQELDFDVNDDYYLSESEFYDDMLHNHEDHLMSEAEDSFDKAILANRKLSRRLGWYEHRTKIAQLLGFTDMSPSEGTFAEAVATWQQTQGLQNDGIIGPKTWRQLQRSLEGKRSKARHINLTRAIKKNRQYSQSLGWRKQQSAIDQMLGFTNISPSETSRAQAIADWQRSNNLPVDGVMGPNTWSKFQLMLSKFIKSDLMISPYRPLPPSQADRFMRALADLESQVTESNDPRKWRFLCWLKLFKQDDVDDRVIEWRKICPSKSGAIGAAWVVGPCDFASGPRPSQVQIEKSFRSISDVEVGGQSIGIFTYVRSYVVWWGELSSFPLDNLKRLDNEVQRAYKKLDLWANSNIGGSSAMPQAYISIKGWIGQRQHDEQSLYHCR